MCVLWTTLEYSKTKYSLRYLHCKMDDDSVPYVPSRELSQQVEDVMESIQDEDTLRTPLSKQSAGENSSSSIVVDRVPIFSTEVISDRCPTSPFALSSELLQLQNETEKMMDSIKASLMTPPQGFKGVMHSDHSLKEATSPPTSPLEHKNEISKVPEMMDSIKSSLMTSSYHDQFSFVAVGAKKLQESEVLNAEKESTDDNLTRSASLIDLSFFSDDGITQEIDTLNDAMPNLKEDLRSVPRMNRDQDETAPIHTELPQEDLILSSEERIQPEVLNVDQDDDLILPQLQFERNVSDLDEAKMIEERFTREILLAREEMLKAQQQVDARLLTDLSNFNTSTGENPCEISASQNAQETECALFANDSSESGISMEQDELSLQASNADLPEKEHDQMDSEGLIFELAMIPIDIVSSIVDSSVATSISKSGLMKGIVYLVQNYPREVLVLVLSVYLYRMTKTAFL